MSTFTLDDTGTLHERNMIWLAWLVEQGLVPPLQGASA